MHLRKLIFRSIPLLCVLMFLAAVAPSAHAAVSGSLTDSNIAFSAIDTEGTKQNSSDSVSMSAIRER